MAMFFLVAARLKFNTTPRILIWDLNVLYI